MSNTDSRDVFNNLFNQANNLLGNEPEVLEAPIKKEPTNIEVNEESLKVVKTVNALTGDIVEKDDGVISNLFSEEHGEVLLESTELEGDFTLDPLPVTLTDLAEEVKSEELDIITDELTHLLGNSMVNKNLRVEDEYRVVTSGERAADFMDDIDPDELDAQYNQVLDTINDSIADINTDSELPYLGEVDLTQYLLIRSEIYTPAFKEFITKSPILERGDFAICVELKGEHITFATINPEPRTLYHIKKVFEGWDIVLINNGKEEPFDIYKFLGKVKLKKLY